MPTPVTGARPLPADPITLADTRIILIGALFRANRFRANPTNLYGADEYIEEQIPEKEFRQIFRDPAILLLSHRCGPRAGSPGADAPGLARRASLVRR